MNNQRTVNGKALGLAFWKKADEVVELVKKSRGIVVMPTGTGKTTQTPQLLHEQGFTRQGKIYISVPRRILAVELAARVADEMGVKLGGLVGYQIRGERKLSHETRIIFMTEGTLRGKIRNNPMLKGVSVVVFDEFHQRTLMSDFNVALIERAQQEGSEVAFLLMSATIDPTYLANHFDCDVVDGSDLDTTYPIAEEYVDPQKNGGLFKTAAEQVERMIMEAEGNGMVFMPGKAEINQTIDAIRDLDLPKNVTVLPLHGDLDGDDRHAPFVERDGITVTVATDIVETGATLPNIGWEVDSGLAREKGYDPVSDISSLKVQKIAKDRLKQRRGRTGRVRDGRYVGLFSQDDFSSRPDRTKPEIFRTPLREVVLTIKSLGLSREGNSIRLIDYPPKTNWKQAKQQLQMLEFVNNDGEANINEYGKKAVELGCDPRESAMLLKSAQLGCLREMSIAIAAQQSHRLLYCPKTEEYEANTAHSKFRTSETCDGWTAVKVIRMAEARGEQSLGSWCRANYVSYRSIQEIWQTSRQLLATMKGLGFSVNEQEGTEENLRKAIFAGLPDRVFQWDGRDWFKRDDDSCLMGLDSVIRERSSDTPVAAWEVIEISTRKGGTLRLITNAVTVEKS